MPLLGCEDGKREAFQTPNAVPIMDIQAYLHPIENAKDGDIYPLRVIAPMLNPQPVKIR